jgi:hypothetical protein
MKKQGENVLVDILKKILKTPALQRSDSSSQLSIVGNSENGLLSAITEINNDPNALALELYNRSVSNLTSSVGKRKRKVIAEAVNGDKSQDQIINEKHVSLLLQECSDNNSYEELWLLLQEDLLRSMPSTRMKLLYLIDKLMKSSEIFLGIVNCNIGIIGRAAGFPVSVSSSVKDMELNREPTQELTEYVKVLMEYWDDCYGSSYSNIHNVRKYLQESLQLSMPSLKVCVLIPVCFCISQSYF